MLTSEIAQGILQAAHDAWTSRNLDGVLDRYCDDLTYSCNTGSFDGGPLIVKGKAEFRSFLQPVLEALDSTSSVSEFKLEGSVGRALLKCELRHRKTGLVLMGTYRQVVTWRGNKILRMDEVHDAPRMEAFWKLVLQEEEQPRAHVSRSPRQSVQSWQSQLPPGFVRRS